ncbi:MAG: type II toxin-antitoxin system RelE/ParE family toxin [Spirochaetes bacterium]|nr:type II toxin-antitoxin system RelE/ParE family toxin [Spirochaetota bacterium]
MSDIKVLITPKFQKTIKKLPKNIKRKLDDEVKKIIDDPNIGQEKNGKLSGIFVHKFKVKTQLYLLAYEFDKDSRILHALGSHENFYRDMENYLN